MKAFDRTGSILCTYQAGIFSKSLKETDCSSMVFLRRFFLSDFAWALDYYDQHIFSFDENECFRSLEEEYGKTEYGKNRLPEEVLYWLGYITRYICYTRELSSKKFYRNIPLKYLIDHYEIYHTQTEEWVISRILENVDPDLFDREKQIKKILRKLWGSVF